MEGRREGEERGFSGRRVVCERSFLSLYGSRRGHEI